jgi:hypothetical protein
MSTPLPPGPGPAVAADVAARLGGIDPTACQLEVDAVNDLCTVQLGVAANADGTWPPRKALGATMLAVRLYRRRDSPAGVATFGAEGAAYVTRNDPDVAQLLGIGAYAPPRVG